VLKRADENCTSWVDNGSIECILPSLFVITTPVGWLNS
jgi:hypothetical protein